MNKTEAEALGKRIDSDPDIAWRVTGYRCFDDESWGVDCLNASTGDTFVATNTESFYEAELHD